MAVSELQRPIEDGKFEEFESRCLEMIESRQVRVADVVSAVELLARKGQGKRVDAIGSLLLDAVTAGDDASATLALARALLISSPENAEFRKAAVKAYSTSNKGNPSFEAALKASGLDGGRPARAALKALDFCLSLKVGSFVVERIDDAPYEVTAIDAQGLFTIKGTKRTTTLTASELAQRFDAVRADDFRVLRRLYPERLNEMAENDPVSLIVAMLHSHSDAIELDVLKQDLVPAVIPPAKWADWWSKAKAGIKRNPNVIVEGRSPVFLRYTQKAVTLEDETWEALSAQQEPAKLQSIVEGYIREKKRAKEMPDEAFLKRIMARVEDYVASVREKRPGDAFACGLVVHELAALGVPVDAALRDLAADVLKNAKNPASFIRGLEPAGLWRTAMELLPSARPEDWQSVLCGLIPSAPEAVLDEIVGACLKGGLAGEVQKHIDAALSDPVKAPDLLSWMWKGPKNIAGLQIPALRELLAKILGTLSALGRSLNPPVDVLKAFRGKMKNALSSRDYARLRSCLEQIEEGMAVTIRRQIDRLEGLGDNAPTEMLGILRQTHPMLWARKRLERWEDPESLWTTAEGLAKKKAELDDLVNVKMRENAKAIGRAAEYGDLSENSEYKFALEERDLLRARLAKLNDELSRAQVFAADEVPTDFVGIGSGVTLSDDHGVERKLRFFGPWDANVEEGIFNYLAPIGQKLMGARVGDRVVLTMDGGEKTFEVKAVWNGLNQN